MIILDNIINFIITQISLNFNFIKEFSSFTKDNSIYEPIVTEVLTYIQFSSATINIIIYLLVTLIILNFIYYIFFKNISYLITLLKFINLFFITLIIVILIINLWLDCIHQI